MSGDGGARLTVLGVGPAAEAARLAKRIDGGDTPPLLVCRTGAIAGFAVRGRAWSTHRAGLRAALRRAAGVAPFLPADPRHALCDAASWPRVIGAAAVPLAEALARDGTAQQWEVTIAAADPKGSAAAFATALREAVLPHALGTRLGAVRGGIVFKVLLPGGAAEVLAQALGAVGDHGVAAAVEGPLPPLAFAAFRLERAESEAVSRAWAMLALRDAADHDEIARRWRGLAFALDPGLGSARPRTLRPLRAAERAYGLLRGLTGGLPGCRVRRDDLLAECGRTVAVPPVRGSFEAVQRRLRA